MGGDRHDGSRCEATREGDGWWMQFETGAALLDG